MTIPLLLAAAVALSLERAAYVWVDRNPRGFERMTQALPLFHRLGPVNSLLVAFGLFKAIQFAVFAGWIAAHGGWRPGGGTSHSADAIGLTAILVGQTLNVQVFRLLGTSGVFYGNRFGQATRHCAEFPFSVLPHPQYVGTCLSIWGLFLIARFPSSDWMALPLVETALYAVTAALENGPALTNE